MLSIQNAAVCLSRYTFNFHEFITSAWNILIELSHERDITRLICKFPLRLIQFDILARI